jgi:uncharacterized 2Fe-2S/4Fe-4S cluster protein (DUF4445 family)
MTGIEMLLEKAGLKRPKKILAGALGFHLNKQDMVRLAIVPDIGSDKITTSLLLPAF